MLRASASEGDNFMCSEGSIPALSNQRSTISK